MRFCFRIVSPLKTYTFQAENSAERMDWVDKITGVIASLLNSLLTEQVSSRSVDAENSRFFDTNGPVSLSDESVNVSRLLRTVPGNDACAECNAPEPDWASLNLGVLICIECSGVHRNLGVHISKVRSVTLDVKVWEPTILDLFCALGNSYCNSVWEELLLLQDERIDESNNDLSARKPSPKDAILRKERYIQSKYVKKQLIIKETTQPDLQPHTVRIWEAVKTNNIQAAYRLLVTSDLNPNTRYDDVNSGDMYYLIHTPRAKDTVSTERKQFDPAFCQKIKESGEPESCMQGCSLLHLACHVGDPVMVELLLQFGADINIQDFHGRTPLHHCVFKKNDGLTKFFLRRGSRTTIKDAGGLTALERTMEIGAITDDELFILFVGKE